MKDYKSNTFLFYYSIGLTILLLVLASILFKLRNRILSKEITVERINIVEADGKTRMILSNKKKMPPAVLNGRILDENQKRNAGLLFYNEDGDECGGYHFGGGDGNSPFSHFTFDQHEQDQILVLKRSEYWDEGEKLVTAGLMVKGQPNTIKGDQYDKILDSIRLIKDKAEKDRQIKQLNLKLDKTNMLWVGKLDDDSYGLFLNDKNNTERLNLYIDKAGNPRLEFKDSLGKVIFSLPK
jgi:hypothetical protein